MPSRCPVPSRGLNALLDSGIGDACVLRAMPAAASQRSHFFGGLIRKQLCNSRFKTYRAGYSVLAVRNRLRHDRLTCDLDCLQLDDEGGEGVPFIGCQAGEVRVAGHNNCVIWLTIGLERRRVDASDKDMFDRGGLLTGQQ